MRTAVLALALAGCDYSGDWLFPNIYDDLPAVVHLTPEGGEDFVPVDLVDPEDIPGAVIYAEVGAALSVEPGGVTATFVGNGGEVCVWMDPETAYWSASVAEKPADDFAQKFAYPDNTFDDGDLDLEVGQSLFYNGTPGVQMGSFAVNYQDSLGQLITVSQGLCGPSNPDLFGTPGALAGRGTAESCSVQTEVGISYTIALETFSTPLDDDRLGFGLLIANGSCDELQALAGTGDNLTAECLIQGESVLPTEYRQGPAGPWFGQVSAPAWEGVTAFESAFCDADRNMKSFCDEEFDAHEEAGAPCEWTQVLNAESRCYCGDIRNDPNAF